MTSSGKGLRNDTRLLSLRADFARGLLLKGEIATVALQAPSQLGFLGLGAQPPLAEWGAMLSGSIHSITGGYWWVVTFPGIAILLSVLGFNLFGDGLRDALDPRLRNRGM